MRRSIGIGALAAVVAGLAAGAAVGWAQHGHGGGAGERGHGSVQACEAEFEAVVRDGRGFGMAFTADQQGYPGPLHVLELKDRLGLSAEQEAKARAMMHAMFSESRPKGAALLDAEARLRKLFADGTPSEAAVRAAAAEVERARREVRLVHLLTHLKTRDLLTEKQRRIYHEARWAAR
jgi:Spy/CpxP family protein refolding chaperone